MTDLPEVIQAMMDPQAYPEPIREVEVVQTQMSFVFMTKKYAYKVKKAVDLGYLDYTTLSKRQFYCNREVELNRRLCPEVYLGVVPITRFRGKFYLEGKDRPVEYAVKMLRLPKFEMMDFLLEHDRVTPEMVSAVAEKIATFHGTALTNDTISAFGELENIRRNNDENFEQTEKYIGSVITRSKFQALRDFTTGLLDKHEALFHRRVRDGRIRDCHGDLHAAHVCFADHICIYDCIEFNDRFRYGDVAAEVAFLAMDLDHYGHADLSHRFVDAYVARTGDEELKTLLGFYKCYRAYVRAKVSCFKSDDPYIGREEMMQSAEVARSYFDLAASYARKKPLLLVTTGLVGTGKSTLARALAQRLGMAVFSSDVIRKQLADVPAGEHRSEEFNRGIYSEAFSRRTYDKLFSGAAEVLREGGSVILDASFIRSEERRKAVQIARDLKADYYILQCVLDEDNIRERLEQRKKEVSASDGRWELLAPQKALYDPVTEVPGKRHLIIDTSVPLTEAVRQVMQRTG
ncbi:MAG: AAA family ATPase [Chloroflexota bacterium]